LLRHIECDGHAEEGAIGETVFLDDTGEHISTSTSSNETNWSWHEGKKKPYPL
jgi:hypothetical protein